MSRACDMCELVWCERATVTDQDHTPRAVSVWSKCTVIQCIEYSIV